MTIPMNLGNLMIFVDFCSYIDRASLVSWLFRHKLYTEFVSEIHEMSYKIEIDKLKASLKSWLSKHCQDANSNFNRKNSILRKKTDLKDLIWNTWKHLIPCCCCLNLYKNSRQSLSSISNFQSKFNHLKISTYYLTLHLPRRLITETKTIIHERLHCALKIGERKCHTKFPTKLRVH